MSAADLYACSNCKDLGWVKTATYVERPYSGTILLITNWLPCETCNMALAKPRPEPMDVRGVKEVEVPYGIKPRALPPRTGCHFCKGRAHTIVEVPVGAGHVSIELPCLKCDTILNWPMCAAPVPGVGFDFAKDLIEASYAPRRRNPRI
jgi:hypothetical protein